MIPPHVIASNDYELLREQLRGDVVGYVVSMMPRRTGGRAFITFLEYRHFTPGGPLNQEFILVRIIWEEMHWFVVIIPKDKVYLAQSIMTELGLRAADGTPHLIVGGTPPRHVHFPVDEPNLFTIKNIEGHFVYHNDPKLAKSAYDFEDEACDAVIETGSMGRQKTDHRDGAQRTDAPYL